MVKEVEHEISNAKAQLLQDGTYDKLVGAIKQLLNNETDTLQHALVRDEITRLQPEPSQLREVPPVSKATVAAKKSQNIFKTDNAEADLSLRSNPVMSAVMPPILENQRFFGQCGVGLNEQESTLVYLSAYLLTLCDPTHNSWRF